MNPNTASSCCNSSDSGTNGDNLDVGKCPHSRSQGKPVDSITVKAMLLVSLMDMRDVPYYFCRDADCPVVYFSADGTQTFTINMVRELVYQKQPHNDERWVCYCFCYTVGHIRTELIATNTSTVPQTIENGVAKGQCACDLRNPQGSCCLGNVRTLIQTLKKSL